MTNKDDFNFDFSDNNKPSINNNNNQNINMDNNYNNNYPSNISNSNFDEIDEDVEKEAMKILQSQQEQIVKLKKQNAKNEKTITLQRDQLSTLSKKMKDYESNYDYCMQIKTQFDTLNQEKENLRSQLYAKKKMTEELQKEFEEISEKFQKVTEKVNSQEESNVKVNQLVELVKQYAKELNEVNQKNRLYEEEINKLNKELRTIMKKDQFLENQKKNIESEMAEEFKNINKDIELLCQWIDNYMGVYFDRNVEIPDIPVFYSKKLDFSVLKNQILSVREKIYKQQEAYEKQIKTLHDEQIDLISKYEKINQGCLAVKNENFTLRENLAKINSSYEEINNKLNKTQLNNYSKESFVVSYLYKLNNKILKMRSSGKSYQIINETMQEVDAQSIFEDNIISLLNYIIDLENQIDILDSHKKETISKEEMNTVKGFYQSRIDSLEEEVKKNLNMMQMYKDENNKLINKLRLEKIDKNNLMTQNYLRDKEGFDNY